MNNAPAKEVRRLFGERGVEAWLDLPLRYGRTFRCRGTVYTCEPEVVRQLLMNRPNTEARSRAHKAICRVTPGSRGLLFLDGEEWRRHVRAVMPAFRAQHVRTLGETMARQTADMARSWANRGVLPDLYTALSELGVRQALRTGYGLDPGHPAVAVLGRELVAYKLETMCGDARRRLDVLPLTERDWLRTPWIAAVWLRLHHRTRRLKTAVQAVLADPSVRVPDEDGWLAGLQKEGLSLAELVSELNHLYGAYNAIDYVVTAAWVELGLHPEWQARLRKELRGRGPLAVSSPEGVPNMMSFMREVLRFYPVAMCVYRQTGQPLNVDGERLPAGSQVAALPYALQRHPEFWDQPEKFDPDRWAGRSDAPVPFSYVPFLEGPRKCIGRDMAEVAFVATVSTLLESFQIDVGGANARVLPYIIPRFERPLPFRIRELSD